MSKTEAQDYYNIRTGDGDPQTGYVSAQDAKDAIGVIYTDHEAYADAAVGAHEATGDPHSAYLTPSRHAAEDHSGIVAGGGSGHTIQDEGVSLATRTNLNFVGQGVSVTDDSGADSSIVSIPLGGTLFVQPTQPDFDNDTPSGFPLWLDTFSSSDPAVSVSSHALIDHGDLPGISEIKAELAASTDFADFKARVAAL